VWMLAAMVVAVRQALDYRSTGRAIAVCVLGWALAIAFAVALGLFLGPGLS
jgi:predicted MFS family arabinose efflux permease